MKILFRANVKKVGYGHVKRCLSVANQFVSEGYEVEFYVDDVNVGKLFPSEGIRYINAEVDEQFFKRLQLNEVDILILDGYFADEKYVKKIKSITEQTFIVVLDSLKKGLIGANLLVNPGFYANEFYGQEQLQEHLLLGTKYTILGKEYRIPSLYKLGEVQIILITMGGLDPKNITQKILPHLLLRYPKIKFYVVIGKYFTSKETLIQMKEKNNNLNLLENVSSLKNYIIESDLCISAAGTTVFEIARCSTPIVLFAQEENQLYSSHYWEKTKGVLNFGFFEEELTQQYMVRINQLIQYKELRFNMSEALTKTSTYGTAVLVNEILKKFNDWKMVKYIENR